MTANCHERKAAFRVRYARGLPLVAFLVPLLLGGCSVSMPMASFIDDRPTGSATPPVNEPNKIELAAAQPDEK